MPSDQPNQTDYSPSQAEIESIMERVRNATAALYDYWNGLQLPIWEKITEGFSRLRLLMRASRSGGLRRLDAPYLRHRQTRLDMSVMVRKHYAKRYNLAHPGKRIRWDKLTTDQLQAAYALWESEGNQ